jgi:hypothetical protein
MIWEVTSQAPEDMATTKAAYRQIDSIGDVLTELEDLQDRHEGSRWPNVSKIILSITTISFGLQSLYLSLLPRNVCFEKETSAFEEGYSTEWGRISSPSYPHG